MNKKETEHLIQTCDKIMDLMECFSPHKSPNPQYDFLWIMTYSMMIRPVVMIQYILYLHHDTFVENETKKLIENQ